MNYTPGPWQTYKHEWDPADIYAGDIPIAVVFDDGPDDDANVSLIAAAPDLLAVLRAVVYSVDVEMAKHVTEEWHTVTVQIELGGTWVAAARAAIAKAEGRDA